MGSVEAQRRNLHVVAFILGVLGLVTVLWFIVCYEKSPVSFMIAMRHAINEQKRLLLYEIDHAVLAQTLRQFAEQQQWTDRDFKADDPELPASLRILKPSSVYIRNDHILIDFGGPFDAMDIRAFKPGIEGYGTKKLGEGLWFYSRDGSGPSE